MVIEHIIDGDEWNAGASRSRGAFCQSGTIIATIEHGGREADAAGCRCAQKREEMRRFSLASRACRRPDARPGRWFSQVGERWQIPCRFFHHHQLETIDMLEQIVEAEDAFALFRTEVAARKQTAEASPGGPVAGISENVRRTIGEDEARSGVIRESKPVFALDEMSAHHAGDGIAVAETEAIEPAMRRLQHQLLGMRGAAQEREIGGDGEFVIVRHVTNRFRAETSGVARYRGRARRETARNASPSGPRPGNSRGSRWRAKRAAGAATL